VPGPQPRAAGAAWSNRLSSAAGASTCGSSTARNTPPRSTSRVCVLAALQRSGRWRSGSSRSASNRWKGSSAACPCAAFTSASSASWRWRASRRQILVNRLSQDGARHNRPCPRKCLLASCQVTSSLTRTFDGFVASAPAGIATRPGRPLPGRDLHPLELRTFHGARGPPRPTEADIRDRTVDWACDPSSAEGGGVIMPSRGAAGR